MTVCTIYSENLLNIYVALYSIKFILLLRAPQLFLMYLIVGLSTFNNQSSINLNGCRYYKYVCNVWPAQSNIIAFYVYCLQT